MSVTGVASAVIATGIALLVSAWQAARQGADLAREAASVCEQFVRVVPPSSPDCSVLAKADAAVVDESPNYALVAVAAGSALVLGCVIGFVLGRGSIAAPGACEVCLTRARSPPAACPVCLARSAPAPPTSSAPRVDRHAIELAALAVHASQLDSEVYVPKRRAY